MSSEKNENIENEFVSADTVFNNGIENAEKNVCEHGRFERGDSSIEKFNFRESFMRSRSLNYERPKDDRSTRSDCTELDICVTDLTSFLSNKDEDAKKLTRWSKRRRHLNRSPDFDNDFDNFGQWPPDYEDVQNFSDEFLTPPYSGFPGTDRWTPDVYESVTRSLNEFRKTYQQSETSSAESLKREMSPFVKVNEYLVRLPNTSYEGRAMYVDRLIVKSFRYLNDLTKIRFREMLDDDVITTVMERYKDQYRDILFVTPCITKCVMVLQDQVANFLDPIKAKDYDQIFFIISDSTAESGGMHWSLLLLNRPKKTFYHYDSMHGFHYNVAFELMYKVSSYFKIKKGFQPDCEQQPNGADCGFYVIHNMLRCIKIIKNEMYDENGEKITLRAPLKLLSSIDETKSIVIKTYLASIVEKIKKTAMIEKV